MELEEARKILLDDFHRTRFTWKVSVDPEALAVLLYGEKQGRWVTTYEERKNIAGTI